VTSQCDLTVVVLTYNNATVLGDCLDALARQQDPDFHVLIVDDDSTDDTIPLVLTYADRLHITVRRNGTRRIPHGRNIGLIKKAFRETPTAALLSGGRVAGWRSRTAEAIAVNDATVRELTWNGVLDFTGGNCAINLDAWPEACFDEDFAFAEDLELAARVRDGYLWKTVPTMVVRHFSRETFAGYARQMYLYGRMKQLFSLSFRMHRPIDHVPTLITFFGLATALAIRSWWPVLLVVPFSVLEALFVVIYRRCSPSLLPLSIAAWLVKNVAWSLGMLRGAYDILADTEIREIVRHKRLDSTKVV
jgi:glycosyltransferase involved in cell wall biosynthesis